MTIEGQGHFFTIYFPGFVCFVLYLAKISGERLQDHWSSGFIICFKFIQMFRSRFSARATLITHTAFDWLFRHALVNIKTSTSFLKGSNRV